MPNLPPRSQNPRVQRFDSESQLTCLPDYRNDAITSKILAHRMANIPPPRVRVPDPSNAAMGRRRPRSRDPVSSTAKSFDTVSESASEKNCPSSVANSPRRDSDISVDYSVLGDVAAAHRQRVRELPQGTSWGDFKVLDVIGRGEYGFVVVARHRMSAAVYAIKILSKRQAKKQHSIEKLLREVEVHRAVSGHQYLVEMAGAFQDADNVYCAMDFCAGADLFALIAREDRISASDARTYFAQLMLVIEHVHNCGIVYRDLKPENVLIDARGILKLADFGLSKPLSGGRAGRTHTHCGTLEYLAPEIITKSGHGVAVDWCAG